MTKIKRSEHHGHVALNIRNRQKELFFSFNDLKSNAAEVNNIFELLIHSYHFKVKWTEFKNKVQSPIHHVYVNQLQYK